MAAFLKVDSCECIVRAREHGGAAEAGGSKSAANGQTVTASSWPRVTIRIIATTTMTRDKMASESRVYSIMCIKEHRNLHI